MEIVAEIQGRSHNAEDRQRNVRAVCLPYLEKKDGGPYKTHHERHCGGQRVHLHKDNQNTTLLQSRVHKLHKNGLGDFRRTFELRMELNGHKERM